MNYLLDTNMVVVYLRDNQMARSIEAELGLLTKQHRLLISVVSIGEIQSIAMRNNWGQRKIERFTSWLEKFLVVDINTEEIIRAYAEIDSFSQGKHFSKKSNFSSRNMGKNDIWIAATANVLNVQLLTTDKDFDHLQGDFIDLWAINLGDYK